jgi:ATP-dependent DNA helicase RecG
MTRENELNLIDELIQSGEGQTIDFKKSEILSNPTKLAKLMVAFANSNGGRILIGICDDGTIEGMKEKKEHERHVMNIGRDKCVPPLVPDFSVINKPEGDILCRKDSEVSKASSHC